MPYDPHQHARLLAGYCVAAQAGERILVQSTTLALPLIEALHNELLRLGAVPLVRLEYPGQLDDFYRYASDALIDSLHPQQLAEVESTQGSIRVLTPTAPARDVSADRPARHRRTLAPVARARAQGRWNLTQYPTPYAAQAAALTLAEYEQFVADALFLNAPDPVAMWGRVRERQARLIERLSRASEVRILAPDTDLRLGVQGRQWINSDGRTNMPSGEVYTGPHEHSASGHIHFGLPTVYAGQLVRGVRLRFEQGRVVSATAEEGQATLDAALATDGGARYLGELGIGTNDGITRPSGSILFDEKMGGTVHLALGNSYPSTGGRNESALHWDLICDLRQDGQLLLDGEVFMQGGQFTLN